jgi:hypothetical protein
VRATTTRAKTQYLLKGIVFGSDGRAMSPFQTAKQNGRRYRYYVPQRDIKEHAGASGLPRMPAAELESAVLVSTPVRVWLSIELTEHYYCANH